MRFLDTNVILRYVTHDDEAKGQASAELFQRVQRGEEELVTSEAIVAECAFILASRRHSYQFGRAEIRAELVPVLSLEGLTLPHKEVCLRALDLHVLFPQLDYEDALAVAHMEARGIAEVVSYDRDFDRVPGVARVEP